jgi:lipoate-protein ligase A
MPETPWRFVDTGFNTGLHNMQWDEERARSLEEGNGVPTLRLFRWNPWAISLGYNQGTAELDVARCQRDGIDIVRRPTGGRAILHAEELTYSVVMYAGRKGILQVYNEISRALVRGLHLFGVNATLQRSQPDFAEEYRHPSSIPCFTSSARYEIEWNGRKLVGSAQRRFGDHDVVLQHGSILCGPAHQRLADYLSIPDALMLERIRTEMKTKTVDLSEICAHPVQTEKLAACIKKGFEEEWNIAFSADDNLRGTDGEAMRSVPVISRRT